MTQKQEAIKMLEALQDNPAIVTNWATVRDIQKIIDYIYSNL